MSSIGKLAGVFAGLSSLGRVFTSSAEDHDHEDPYDEMLRLQLGIEPMKPAFPQVKRQPLISDKLLSQAQDVLSVVSHIPLPR